MTLVEFIDKYGWLILLVCVYLLITADKKEKFTDDEMSKLKDGDYLLIIDNGNDITASVDSEGDDNKLIIFDYPSTDKFKEFKFDKKSGGYTDNKILLRYAGRYGNKIEYQLVEKGKIKKFTFTKDDYIYPETEQEVVVEIKEEEKSNIPTKSVKKQEILEDAVDDAVDEVEDAVDDAVDEVEDVFEDSVEEAEESNSSETEEQLNKFAGVVDNVITSVNNNLPDVRSALKDIAGSLPKTPFLNRKNNYYELSDEEKDKRDLENVVILNNLAGLANESINNLNKESFTNIKNNDILAFDGFKHYATYNISNKESFGNKEGDVVIDIEKGILDVKESVDNLTKQKKLDENLKKTENVIKGTKTGRILSDSIPSIKDLSFPSANDLGFLGELIKKK